MRGRNPARLKLESYVIGSIEEPRRPEGFQTLTAVREQMRVGERLYTPHDFLPILEQGLMEDIVLDVVWPGGIREKLRVGTLPERILCGAAG